MPVYLAEAGAPGGVSLATLDTLIAGIKSAIAWIFSLFARIVSTISSNDLLLYPVLLCMVIAAVTLVYCSNKNQIGGVFYGAEGT